MFTSNPQITHSELEIQVLSVTAGLHFLLILAFLSLHNRNTGTPILLACERVCTVKVTKKKKERKYVVAHFSLHPKDF